MIKKKIYKHIAVIPARSGSVGFPKKNQIFFDNTADFLDNLLWLDEIIVTSNDKVVLKKARERKYIDHKRSKVLSKSNVSIKSVFKELVDSLNIEDDVILWLFYLPILYKNISDFEKAKIIIEKPKTNSLCTFIPAKTHPFNTWRYERNKKKLSQYIKNNCFRRQDLPPAWMHYHYVSCFKAKILKKLNSELLNAETYPVFLSDNYAKNLIEIDEPKNYEKWKKINRKLKYSNEKKK